MDRPMDEYFYFFYSDAIDASENGDFPIDFAVFTKELGTDGPTD